MKWTKEYKIWHSLSLGGVQKAKNYGRISTSAWTTTITYLYIVLANYSQVYLGFTHPKAAMSKKPCQLSWKIKFILRLSLHNYLLGRYSSVTKQCHRLFSIVIFFVVIYTNIPISVFIFYNNYQIHLKWFECQG